MQFVFSCNMSKIEGLQIEDQNKGRWDLGELKGRKESSLPARTFALE